MGVGIVYSQAVHRHPDWLVRDTCEKRSMDFRETRLNGHGLKCMLMRRSTRAWHIRSCATSLCGAPAGSMGTRRSAWSWNGSVGVVRSETAGEKMWRTPPNRCEGNRKGAAYTCSHMHSSGVNSVESGSVRRGLFWTPSRPASACTRSWTSSRRWISVSLSSSSVRQGVRPHGHRLHLLFEHFGFLEDVPRGLLAFRLGLGELVALLIIDALRFELFCAGFGEVCHGLAGGEALTCGVASIGRGAGQRLPSAVSGVATAY